MKPEIHWFIIGRCGLYYRSNCATRRDAINDHCRKLGIDWKACRKNGDRAIKLAIVEPEVTTHDQQ